MLILGQAMPTSVYSRFAVIVWFGAYASLAGGVLMVLGDLAFAVANLWQTRAIGDNLSELSAAFVYGAAAMGVVGFVVAVVLAIFRQRYRKGLLIVLVVLGVLLSLPVSFLLVVGIGANKSLATAWAIIALNALTAGGALGVAAWRVLPR
ncbi:hypothetical protein B5J92_02735 [Moraxella atlantae]|nr:hypothetical protein B5J92_02735 [Moraxella atlantae]